MRILAGLLLGALTTGALAADATVYVPALAPVVVQSRLPDCANPAVLANIMEKFAFQDAVILHSGLAIVTIDRTRETRFKDGPSLVDVRFCTGVALMSDGHLSEVVYIIEAPMKGLGLGGRILPAGVRPLPGLRRQLPGDPRLAGLAPAAPGRLVAAFGLHPVAALGRGGVFLLPERRVGLQEIHDEPRGLERGIAV
jgi:hypothetical protein